jgi:hypothetical protein
MPSRADAVLAVIPLLVVSGPAVRAAVATFGVGTALSGVPLVPAGYVAASVVVLEELLVGPVAREVETERE